MNNQSTHPEGELLLRTSPMPSDTNGNGDIFGGWIMSQMDIAGGMMAMDITCGRAVTVAVDSIKFIKPVNVGDVVCCYGTLLRTGTTSVTICLEVWVKPSVWRTTAPKTGDFFKVTEASFTYVAIDHEGHKRPVPKNAPPENNADEKRIKGA